MSKIEVDAIEPQSGTTLTIGASGDTVTVPSGVTLDTSNSTLTLPDNSVTTNKIADSNITLAKLSATGTASASTFLRGDNSWGAVSSDYVKLATVNASSSASLAIDGYFTSDYQRYEIHASDVIPSANCDFFYRVYSGGSEVTSSIYNNTNYFLYTDSTPSSQINAQNAGSQDMDSPSDYFKFIGDDHYAGQPCIFKIVIHDPLNTNRRKMVELMTAFSGNGGSGGVMVQRSGHGVVKSTDALSGFAFHPTAGNITSGTFKLYGIK